MFSSEFLKLFSLTDFISPPSSFSQVFQTSFVFNSSSKFASVTDCSHNVLFAVTKWILDSLRKWILESLTSMC